MAKVKSTGDAHDNNNNASDTIEKAEQITSRLSRSHLIPWSTVMLEILETKQYPIAKLEQLTSTKYEILLLLILGDSNQLSYQAGAKILGIHQTLYP